MGVVNLALWAGGVLLMVLGISQARGPYGRLRALEATDENLRRYDEWRGGRRESTEGEVTGADVMRHELRRQVQLWGGVVIAGFVLVFLGFAVGS